MNKILTKYSLIKTVFLTMALGTYDPTAAQNAIAGAGFTNGWPGSCNANTNFAYFNTSVGTTYTSGALTPQGTGNQYWRMGVDWGGTIKQMNNGSGTDVAVLQKTKYTLNSACTGMGAFYYNVASTSYRYVFKTKDAGNNPTGDWVFFEIQGATVQTVSAVSGTAPTYAGMSVPVTATLSGAFSTGQSAYLRYSSDNFSTSTIVEMTGSGTSYTANIPNATNTPGATIKYYIFTSGSSATITSADADLYSINLNNNSGSNYTYTVPTTYGATSAGNWNTGATWAHGSVPASGSAVTIAANVTLDGAATVGNITINNGATLDGSTNTLTVNNGSTFTNNGTFTANTGKIAFAGTGTVSGTVVFNDVDISNGVNFGSASTVNGILQLLTGGYVSTNAPTYGSSSTLKYNLNATYNRSAEWKTASGAGYPANVQLSNNTILVPGGNANTGSVLNCAGNLTIDAGSAIYMDYSTNDMTVPLIIGGNLVMSGNLSASDASGGDIKVAGNWTRTGTFAPKGRAVFFNGTGSQTITATSGETFDYVIVDKAAGNLILANNATCNQTLTLTTCNIVLGSNNLLLTTGASGGSTSTHVVTNGAGKVTISNFTGSKTFPVGPTTAIYAPVIVNNNVSARDFSVNVGTTVTSPTDANKVVNLQWDITPSNGSGNDANLTFQWPASSQAPGFVFSAGTVLQMGHYNTGTSSWDYAKTGTISGSDPYTVTGNNFTSFSPFAVGSSGALPIELVDFKAVAKDNTTLLNWSTASEKNNDHFNIERSSDATNWQKIATIKGHGTTYATQQYNYADVQPNAGVNYYRLKQVDDNGTFTYSKIVSVLIGKGFGLKTYPNPAFTELTVLGIDETGSVQILDVTGKIVKTITGTNLLNINDLQNGIYFVKGFDASGAALGTTRFVKN